MDTTQRINQRIKTMTRDAVDRLTNQIGHEFGVEIKLYENDPEEFDKVHDAEDDLGEVFLRYVVRHRPIVRSQARLLHRTIAKGLH